MQSTSTALTPRSADRFGLGLPITMEGEECACHDLSATGVLLEAAAAPAVGAQVGMTLQYEAQGRDFRLDCTAEVVRVERHGENYNIALRLSQPLFAPAPDQPRRA